MPRAAEMDRKQGQHGDLGGEGLGAGDADLRSGVKVDAAVHGSGDGAADDVADAERALSLAFRFAQGGQRVRSFARLSDADDDRVLLHGRIAIAELRGVFDLDGDAGKLLEWMLADEC